MTEHFDLAIIGTGSGNSILDERFEDWKVAIIERDAFGGTCLNRGCIPTKMLAAPADQVMQIRSASKLGVSAPQVNFDWLAIRDRVFGRIDPIAQGGAEYRVSQPHVTVYAGSGRFVGAKTLEVTSADGTQTLTADRFVLAAGARPVVPDIPGLDQITVHTSDSIMRVDAVPGRLLVLGGGFIAVELAHVFSAFGSEVSMVLRGDRMLSSHDPAVADAITRVYQDRCDVLFNSAVTNVAPQADGTILATIHGPGGSVTRQVDAVLIATGRVPNSDELDVAATGVATDERGFVVTDDALRTSVPGVYALGDLRTPLMLKHVANHEARVIQHNLLHTDSPQTIRETVVPHAVFGWPHVASVGLTQTEVERTGRAFVQVAQPYGSAAFGWATEDQSSFCKLIADPDTWELLGAHIVGPHASILLQPLVQGMTFGQTVPELARGQMYPHPAATEVVEQALLALLDAADQSG